MKDPSDGEASFAHVKRFIETFRHKYPHITDDMLHAAEQVHAAFHAGAAREFSQLISERRCLQPTATGEPCQRRVKLEVIDVKNAFFKTVRALNVSTDELGSVVQDLQQTSNKHGHDDSISGSGCGLTHGIRSKRKRRKSNDGDDLHATINRHRLQARSSDNIPARPFAAQQQLHHLSKPTSAPSRPPGVVRAQLDPALQYASSASARHHPPQQHIITVNTPQANGGFQLPPFSSASDNHTLASVRPGSSTSESHITTSLQSSSEPSPRAYAHAYSSFINHPHFPTAASYDSADSGTTLQLQTTASHGRLPENLPGTTGPPPSHNQADSKTWPRAQHTTAHDQSTENGHVFDLPHVESHGSHDRYAEASLPSTISSTQFTPAFTTTTPYQLSTNARVDSGSGHPSSPLLPNSHAVAADEFSTDWNHWAFDHQSFLDFDEMSGGMQA